MSIFKVISYFIWSKLHDKKSRNCPIQELIFFKNLYILFLTSQYNLYLHNANGGPTIVGEVTDGGDHNRGIKERLTMTGEEHEQTHHSHGRPFDHS